jgi:hypothetical protein
MHLTSMLRPRANQWQVDLVKGSSSDCRRLGTMRLLVKNQVGVEKLGSKTRFPSGEFLPIRVFLLVVVAYALAIAGCALMLRNRTSRFRFCATAAR